MSSRSGYISAYLPWAPGCREDDAPQAITETIAVRGDVPYLSGIVPEPRPVLPGYDPGVVGMLVGIFLLLAVNLRHCSAFFKSFFNDLWQVRRRSNAFDERTINEARVTVTFVFLVCVCEGILVFSAAIGPPLATSPAIFIGLFIAVALIYYLFQLSAYYIVGQIFTGKTERSQWLKGFNASQSLLGIALTIPALCALFDPQLAPVMCTAGAGLYLIARMIFIMKGFRIFYTIPTSLIYFILYLCTLEIVPLFVLYRAGALINGLEPFK